MSYGRGPSMTIYETILHTAKIHEREGSILRGVILDLDTFIKLYSEIFPNKMSMSSSTLFTTLLVHAASGPIEVYCDKYKRR
jgi:hypothetical protein